MEELIKHKRIRKENLLDIKKVLQLNTKRLLSFYKVERKKYLSFVGNLRCHCCGELYSELDDNIERTKLDEKLKIEWLLYLNDIKSELNKREHIK